MSGYRIDRQVTEFGEHVRGWRMVLGLTAQQVSERAGITRDTLRKIESGNPNVSFNSVTQVLRALGILAAASRVISEGEVLQLTRSHDLNLDQDTYLKIIYF